ncbi:DUF4013 domain-containing protein [Haloferax namakaokahaiae]|uniref:DUF4013 domain-containing protein n=1 Tax=Haloferax namakaokahaiae TaxID=1748331 RepID=A0ABD5Z9S6_9EURY
MLSDALWFLKRSDDWVATTIIGGVLSLLSVLIIPAFILQGYLVKAMRAAANGEEAAPSFTDWGELFVDGVKLFVVGLGWSLVVIVPMILLTIVLGIGSAALTQGATDPSAVSSAGSLGLGIFSLVGFLLIGLLGLLVGFLVPAASVNFAIEGNLGAGFDVRTITGAAFTSDYVVAWVLAIVVSMVLGTIGSVLSIVLVGLFLLFYVQVMTYYLFARGYADGLGYFPGSSERSTAGW